jgi:DNA-binding transcriptional regulator YiaG
MTKKLMQYAICGLDYVYIENVPVHRTRHGLVMDVDLARLERKIAHKIVRDGVPLRGAEVQFLRKVLGWSLENLGRRLGLSAPAISKWERSREKRLRPANEVAVRALVAEQLGIPLEGKFTILRGKDEIPFRFRFRLRVA